jgi:hypothetical protein
MLNNEFMVLINFVFTFMKKALKAESIEDAERYVRMAECFKKRAGELLTTPSPD